MKRKRAGLVTFVYLISPALLGAQAASSSTTVGSCPGECRPPHESSFGDPQAGGHRRQPKAQDYLAMEDIRDILFAPEGQAVAYTRLRPNALARQDYHLSGAGGGDVWVQRAPGQPPQNVTQGARDGSSWRTPVWAPDGQRLAMWSTRGGRWRVWVWERAGGALRPVLPEVRIDREKTVHWVDAHRFLLQLESAADTMYQRVPVLPPGAGPPPTIHEAGIRVAGQEIPAFQGPLLLVDVRSGTPRVVAPRVASLHNYLTDRGGWWPSPDGRWIAVTRITYGDATHDQEGWKGFLPVYRIAVEVRDLDGRVLALSTPLPEDVNPQTVAWSPDGAELVFVDDAVARPGLLPRLFRVQPARSQVQVVTLDSLGPDTPHVRSAFSLQLRWTTTGEQIIYYSHANNFRESRVRRTKWLVPRTGPLRALSDADAAAALAVPDSAERRRVRVDSTYRRPAPGAQLAAVAPRGGSAVYVQADTSGLQMWRVSSGLAGRPETLVRANTHLGALTFGTWQKVPYTSLRGEPLLAWLYRPAGVPAGARMPLVVQIYLGEVQQQNNEPGRIWPGINPVGGYALLKVSMPQVASGGVGPSRRMQVPNGVLPALDSVIAQGVADSTRLFVQGASNGGWSTVSLIEQTNRFKAAAALSGLYNTSSYWGSQQKGLRYMSMGPGYPFTGWPEKTAPTGGGISGPLWQAPQEYLQDSPLFFADRIHTPVLLLHGDDDPAVPVEQSEKMYAALWYQGKRARLVTYWGGRHYGGPHNGSPQQQRDHWYQITAWFDEFGDIARDANGNIVFEHGRAKPRGGKPPLTVADFARFDSLALGRRSAATAAPSE